jgi:hypothetical protein
MTAPVKVVLDHIFAATNENWRFKLAQNWQAIIGPLAVHMRLERIDENTAILGVYDAHWMQELYMFSRTIVRTINEALGGYHIQQVRFKLVPRPAKSQEVSVTAKRPHHSMRPLNQRERKALDAIPDEHLKNALCAFLHKTTEF